MHPRFSLDMNSSFLLSQILVRNGTTQNNQKEKFWHSFDGFIDIKGRRRKSEETSISISWVRKHPLIIGRTFLVEVSRSFKFPNIGLLFCNTNKFILLGLKIRYCKAKTCGQSKVFLALSRGTSSVDWASEF